MSKLYVTAADAADTFFAASAAVAVTACAVNSTWPLTGVKVTVEPDTAEVNFEVMSAVPANNLVVAASEVAARATVITPVAAAAVTVGAAGATLSKL